MTLRYTPSIVRIVTSSNEDGKGSQHVGMGVLVDAQHVITCCHVVNQACGRPVLQRTQPDAANCLVTFPFAENETCTAALVAWGWSTSGGPDAAVLKLSAVPSATQVGTFTNAEVAGLSWKCDGWDSQGVEREAEGRLGSVLAAGERQMNSREGVGVRINNGYSGTPVWCPEEEAFAGIVVTKDRDQAENGAAYMIPASRLKALWQPLIVVPKKRWPPKRGTLAIGVFILFPFVAYLFNWFRPDPPPQPVLPQEIPYQIIDSVTRQRILRDFRLAFDGVDEPKNSEHFEIELPPDVRGAVTNVECKGYEKGPPVEVQERTIAGRLIRQCAIKRDPDHYLNTILPNYSELTDMPSNREIRFAMEKNQVPAEEVVFLVHNKTEQALDVLLYYLPPTDLQTPSLTLVANPTVMPAILPHQWSVPFDDFQFTDGYFVISVSDSGRQAETVASIALYQKKYAVLIVTAAGEHPVARVEFFDHDPRPPSQEKTR